MTTHPLTAIPEGRVARPLRVLVPLIKHELAEGDAAGLEHYRRAGEMLVEAQGQVARGSWGRWLIQNFELSRRTAYRYMRLARVDDVSALRGTNLYDAIGEARGGRHWQDPVKKNSRQR